MVSVRFLTRHPDGTTATQLVQAKAGQSVMQAATEAGIEAIAADCGGMLSCATCHVYVQPEWAGQLPAPSGDEFGMLEFTAAPRRDHSRLSCQILLAPELDGLAVELPERQY